MGKFEEDFIYQNNPFIAFLKCWFRFIDDIFFIFSGSHSQLEEFKTHINSRLPSIKFSLEYSRESVSFLDVLVTKTNLELKTQVFRKKTDRNSFLDFSSYHPPGLKRGLPYSQFLRIRRICSSDNIFEEQASELLSRFLAKGFDRVDLENNLQRVRELKREDLLVPKAFPAREFNIVCATTFSPVSQDIKKCVCHFSDIPFSCRGSQLHLYLFFLIESTSCLDCI